MMTPELSRRLARAVNSSVGRKTPDFVDTVRDLVLSGTIEEFDQLPDWIQDTVLEAEKSLRTLTKPISYI